MKEQREGEGVITMTFNVEAVSAGFALKPEDLAREWNVKTDPRRSSPRMRIEPGVGEADTRPRPRRRPSRSPTSSRGPRRWKPDRKSVV